MKYLFLTVLCFGCAYADVSELLYKPEPFTEPVDTKSDSKPSPTESKAERPQPVPEHLEARPYSLLSNGINPVFEHEPATLPHFYETVQVEEPAGVPFALINDGVGIVDAIEVLPLNGETHGEFVAIEPAIKTVQLTAGHVNYQGPYHYEKPKLPLDYVAPDAPKLKDDATLVSNEYLPPRVATADNLAKRHATYFFRRG